MFKRFVWLNSVLALLIISGCATTNFSYAQKTMDHEDARVVEVVNLPNLAQDDIFVRSNSWMVDQFTSAKSVVQFSDKEAGLIKGKYVFDTQDGPYIVRVKSVITIETKDEKARITLENPAQKPIGSIFGGESYNLDYERAESQKFYDDVIEPAFSEMAKSFKEGVMKDSSSW